MARADGWQVDDEQRWDAGAATPEARGFASPVDTAPLDYARDLGDPGAYPHTRGPAHRRGPGAAWIQRELSGEGNAVRSNQQLRYLIGQGAVGLDVIGDAPSQALLDPDHPLARHAVGTQGVSVCRLQDYVDLYDGIPLDRISTSHSLSAPFTVAALYLTAQHYGFDPAKLRGSVIQAPFYTEDYAYATMLPYSIRMRLALDTIQFATEHLPKFHSFVEDTYYVSDGGIDAVEEMAFGFVEIREIVRRLLARGLGIDEFGARDPRSLAANITVHTSGASLTAQQPVNNVVRGALQAAAVALAGVKAMEISAFDEAYRTPSEAAHMVGLRTQQIVALETDLSRWADPLGGSYLVEHLTDEIERRILARVAEIEALGPAEVLFDRGYFRGILEAAMAERGRAVLDGSQPVVGVNCFPIPDHEDTMLREHTDGKIEPWLDHVDDLRAWKAGRDAVAVADALAEVQQAAAEPEANLMPHILTGHLAQATIGEMAGALRAGAGHAADPLAAAAHAR
jgi:methylmalonyl-CoA mutase N-terminal domain/subunit